MDAFELFDDPEVKEEFNEAFYELDKLEEIQLLSDLKYLPLKAFEDGSIEISEMKNAIIRFRQEYNEALKYSEMSNLKDIKLASEVLEQEELSSEHLSQREVFVLKEITGLDNELVINDIKVDTATLLSRVLIYRYRIFDLAKTVLPNFSLTSDVIEKLKNAARSIGYHGNWLEFGNILANQQQLSSFCLSSSVLTNNVFGDCIFIKLKTKNGRKVINEMGGLIKRKTRFLNAIDDNIAKSIIRDFIHHKDRSKVTEEVDKYMTLMPNIFMRRVLQVKLWIMGLYQGRLDDYFGPLSVNALSDFLMTIIENQDKGRSELGRILYNLKNDQCIVNINHLLTDYFIPIEKADIPVEQSSVSQIFDFVIEDKMSVNSIKTKNKAEIQKECNDLTSSLKTELRKESKTIIQKQSGSNRRQYKAKKGIMKFFSGLFRFLKNTYNKIKKLIQKLVRLIKKASKIIYDEIREAFKNFKRGLSFLFGKRIINPSSQITTDYDFDFDGITKFHSIPSQKEIQLHTTTIKNYSSAVYPTLNFVRAVIQWGLRISTGPIGWVKILVGIARLFKNMLNQKTETRLILH